MSTIYEPLDVVSHQIRLLYLHPDADDAVVRCDLEKVYLADNHRFIALSYQWGDETVVADVVVNGAVTPIHKNLQTALVQLRSMKAERSLQVRMMKHVYSAAHQTFAWLGEPGADGAAAAIASMRSASHELPQQTDGINTMPQECVCAASASSDETHNQDILPCHICQTKSTFQNIENLFNQGYWQRRWIVQEIAASARVRFGCGKEIIDLQSFKKL
ncbi:heterokaryon incompatibility protein-domain-containing protein [Xylaria arbuscula]|nr:heterokaryon incompatibility protein-domain-containing protein [Xylaria arbuscula]